MTVWCHMVSSLWWSLSHVSSTGITNILEKHLPEATPPGLLRAQGMCSYSSYSMGQSRVTDRAEGPWRKDFVCFVCEKLCTYVIQWRQLINWLLISETYHVFTHIKVFFPSFTESATDCSTQAFTDWVHTMQWKYFWCRFIGPLFWDIKYIMGFWRLCSPALLVGPVWAKFQVASENKLAYS